ncbi:MAG TPA: tripartite tricarboxylate transporter substrate binding protein [Anaeromyxobacter sp.]|nr:tripartite tricarboxylate transporter substrate binding protein [Anaeromyxobacter sp.]
MTPKNDRRSLPFLGALTLALVALAPGSRAGAADAWKPTKPVQLVVPYAPGGGSDVLGRSIAAVIQEGNLNPTPLVVVNQAGGSGTVGTTAVAQQPGNDHVLLTFISGQVAAPLVAGKGTATYKDLTLIGGLAIDEQLVIVEAGSPFKSIDDVVKAAKARPGELTIGGTATGQEDQMCNRLFERAAGVKLRYVPFNSGGEVLTALVGKHVDLAWANPGEFFSQWEAKLVRPLAVARKDRLAKFSDVPTFKEKGFDVTFRMFRGMAAPPQIPAAAAAHYENVMKRLAESPAWKEKYLDKYLLTPSWMGSKDFAKFVAQSEQEFRKLLVELELLKDAK